jgi:hypothetical protein
MVANKTLCAGLAAFSLLYLPVSGFLWFSSGDITCKADWPSASQEKSPWEDPKSVISRAAVREWNVVVPVTVNHAGGSFEHLSNTTNNVLLMDDWTGLDSRATQESPPCANTTTQENCCVVNWACYEFFAQLHEDSIVPEYESEAWQMQKCCYARMAMTCDNPPADGNYNVVVPPQCIK